MLSEEEWEDMRVLRRRWAGQDIANDGAVSAPSAANRCACGNVLTIADRGDKCRQCVLADRLAR